MNLTKIRYNVILLYKSFLISMRLFENVAHHPVLCEALDTDTPD